ARAEPPDGPARRRAGPRYGAGGPEQEQGERMLAGGGAAPAAAPVPGGGARGDPDGRAVPRRTGVHPPQQGGAGVVLRGAEHRPGAGAGGRLGGRMDRGFGSQSPDLFGTPPLAHDPESTGGVRHSHRAAATGVSGQDATGGTEVTTAFRCIGRGSGYGERSDRGSAERKIGRASCREGRMIRETGG